MLGVKFVEQFRKMMAVFIPNRANFPLDELAQHQDRFIAFNPGGSRIIASAETYEELFEQINASGYDPALCCVE